jgi:3-hydroxyacyl-[acyl-carrier-protein] dehydratase
MCDWIGWEEVVKLELGKSAQAYCNVPNTLALFETHFPRFPVLPGVLILDSLVQLAHHLLHAQNDHSWRLGHMQNVRFRHFVRPGDQMEIAVELNKLEAVHAFFSGVVRVEGRVMVTVRQLQLICDAQEGIVCDVL